MIIDWEGGFITDRPCINIATTYTVDSIGIFYLCQECYKEECKRVIKSEVFTLGGVYNDK